MKKLQSKCNVEKCRRKTNEAFPLCDFHFREICAEKTTKGTNCKLRKPCRFHSEELQSNSYEWKEENKFKDAYKT